MIYCVKVLVALAQDNYPSQSFHEQWAVWGWSVKAVEENLSLRGPGNLHYIGH